MPTFDELKYLAHRDPEAFEKLRQELIDDSIFSSSKRLQHRLRGLQFTIDARRRIASSPIKALLDIQRMMYDSILSLQQVVRCKKEPSESAVRKPKGVLLFRISNSSKD
ncbi:MULTISPECIES: DUF3135 domain-containing protein [Marinobacter]|jgi:hypothetical protein|uniref:DUF3135 domain-containing protein n=1 Tax=Marinobacter TaxID=2742 RepID=UPI001108B8A8|nr:MULTISPECIES: DUF3135 domain-containing protein [Marinobacter]MBL3827318.1 DUF3135 domain-containing protein [Marinobacter sp. MC3]MBL3895804.1 DUF3135 domain-containing protein [Marinobacter sp. MW3]|tara:strand:+ start:538 stop:864 length:327 start_codon:yes stop_codon:yes gene_type:complete|eukprot:TRINITY_DN108858_c0_g1_i1.p2 TRINITY_DN108858_c0_g1~~TRINITY_DN108858_c0_g1_i1.p2  ORF type:complete len:109 (-),score=5.38 TRINITY_DN108858_c0_g1_i1:1644-1970(-)